mmetsp:Transcript_53358/g.133958  ORF Transcript_53358/g.133958 Transcript_53358/m.133958 type:complete len:130 (-) Transcript_53358:56-445(-)
MSAAFLDLWYSDAKLINEPLIAIHCVRCIPLWQLLAEQNVKYADVFSLDVENAEFPVLRTLDFSAFRTAYWLIESRPDLHDDDIRQLLIAHGYAYLGEFARSLWFAHEDLVDPVTARVRLERAAYNLAE